MSVHKRKYRKGKVTMKTVEISHPGRLDESHRRWTSAFNLYRAGGIPHSIAGWMLVVPLRHALRAIYGNDLRAAMALLIWAVAGRIPEAAVLVRIRLYGASHLLALVWTWAWGWWRWVRYRGAAWAFLWDRRESPEPALCDECGWRGPRRWAVHAYRDDGCGDVEPVDECPLCGGDV